MADSQAGVPFQKLIVTKPAPTTGPAPGVVSRVSRNYIARAAKTKRIMDRRRSSKRDRIENGSFMNFEF